MSYLNIDGLNVYYEKSGAGKPVVLLHGWGQNTTMMSYIASFLANHFEVYNLDFPGFGKSDTLTKSYSCEDYTNFLISFLDELRVENPIIIAHSFGCRIAIRYASVRPVRKMCLTGAAGLKDKLSIEKKAKVAIYKIGKKLLQNNPEKLKKFQDKAGSTDYKNASGVMRETLVKVVNDDIEELLPKIDVETLLVFGSLDEATPVEKGRKMEKLMPNAALVVFENDDHYAYWHQGDRFNRVLEAFLRSEYE